MPGIRAPRQEPDLNQPLPKLRNLEFSGEEPFWSEGDTTPRKVFLMPVTSPEDFLAFGVLGREHRLHFAAHGRVEEHLGAFISRMVREEAEVELHAWPPLPRHIIIEYAFNPPWEGHEYEDPPNPPIRGLTSEVGGSEALRGAALWGDEDSALRRVFIMPLREPSHFLAFGVVEPENRVCFALMGSLQEELEGLISRMVQEGARVELYAWPPLPGDLLSRYIATVPR